MLVVRYLFVAVVACLASCQSEPQRPTFAPSDAIDVMQEQVAAWNRGDIDGFMQGYWKSDSLQFITSKGLKTGWETVRQGYHRSYPTREKMGSLQFDYQRVEWADEREQRLHVLGRWKVQSVTDPSDTGHSGWFHLTFLGFPEGPRIVADHTW
ncbi:MAG: hypothetical protein ACO3DK_06835 [Bacteroidia bacterium]